MGRTIGGQQGNIGETQRSKIEGQSNVLGTRITLTTKIRSAYTNFTKHKKNSRSFETHTFPKICLLSVLLHWIPACFLLFPSFFWGGPWFLEFPMFLIWFPIVLRWLVFPILPDFSCLPRKNKRTQEARLTVYGAPTVCVVRDGLQSSHYFLGSSLLFLP